MKMPVLHSRVLGEPVVGAKSSYRRTLTQADVSMFIGVTWDVNPLHTDDEYVKGTHLERRIVPGLLTASLLTHMGGLWAFMATQMDLAFHAPVYIGDTIEAEAEVAEWDEERGWVRLSCRCVNEKGEVVLTGDVSGYPGQFQ